MNQISNPLRKFYSFVFIGLAFYLGSQISYAQDCSSCSEELKNLHTELEAKKKTEDLQKRNQDYLAQLTPDQVSPRVKVRSNLLIIQIRLETIHNNLMFIKKKLQEKGCTPCLKEPIPEENPEKTTEN